MTMKRMLSQIILVLFLFLQHHTLLMAAKPVGGIRGWVADSQTAEPLETAQVMVLGKDFGAVTDKNGFFKMILKTGHHHLTFQMVGYQTDTVAIDISPDRTEKIYVYLQKKPYQYEPVTVLEFRKESAVSPMGLNLDISTLSSRPVLGEVDVFRLVQNLPGVAYTSDYSGLMYIRGSNFDQTQIAFDDAPILNPYHLGGTYSGFNAEGVRSVQFSPGIYNAENGGYLGGRINIVPKDGTESQRYHAKLSFGLLTSKISYGNSIGRSSFFFTARRSYFDLVETLFSGEIGSYYFYDMQGGYKLLLNKDNYISLHCFYSRDLFTDILEHDEIGVKGLTQPSWGNRVISLKWQSNLGAGSKLLSHFYISSGDAYSNTLHIDIDNRLENISWRESLNRKTGKHDISAGFEISRLTFQGDWRLQDAVELANNTTGPPEYIFFDYAPEKYSYCDSTWQMVFYLQDAYEINPLTRIYAGIRTGWYGLGKHYFFVPRFQLTQNISPNTELIVTLARHEQYFYTLKTVRDSDYFAPFSAYFPINAGEKPLRSNYLSAGLKGLVPGLFNLRLEGYLKQMENIPAISKYRSHEKIRQKQFASGLDIYVERQMQKGISYSAVYSLGFARIREGKNSYTASFERLHHIKLECSYLSKTGWQVGLRGFYLSGLPYTPLIGKFIGAGTDDDEEIIWAIDYSHEYRGGFGLLRGEENSMRFPPYHRLDLNVSKVWYFEHSRLWLKLQVLNVYNKKNPVEYRWELYQKPIRDDVNNLPTVPSIEITYEF